MKKSNFRVSKMAEGLLAPEIIKQAWEINDRIKKGEKIFNFTIGDFAPSVFSIPEKMKEEIISAYHSKQTNYPPTEGLPELREAISEFIKRKGNFNFDISEIIVASGTRPIIFSAYNTIVEKGDTVIYPVPSWNSNHYCHITGVKELIIESKFEDNFMPTAESILPHIREAHLVSLCSPLNPTGTLFKKEQLKNICEVILEENHRRGEDERPVYLLLDQVYWVLTYENYKHYDPAALMSEMRDYTIYSDGLSKTFAATGVRVGWAYGPKKVIDKMKTVVSHMGSWAPRPEQTGVAKFLKDAESVDEYLNEFKKELYKRLKFFYDSFLKLKSEGFYVDAIPPQGALYLTIKLGLHGKRTKKGKVLEKTKDITDYILNDARVALVPFSSFGAYSESPWYRLSVGTCTIEIAENAVSMLRESLSKLS